MIIALDTETTALWPWRTGTDGRPGRCRLVQLWNNQHRAVYDLDDPEDLRDCAEVLAKCDQFICFNVNFDRTWIEYTFGKLNAKWTDVGLIRAAVKGGGTYDLKTLAKWDLGRDLNKAVRGQDWSGDLTEEQIEYAAEDAEVTWMLYEKHNNASHWIFHNAMPAVLRMEKDGLFLDRKRHAIFKDRVEAGSIQALRWLENHIAEINWNSGAQVSEFLGEFLPSNIKRIWPKTEKTRILQTDADTLRHFIPQLDYPLTRSVAVLLLLKKRRTYSSFFGDSLAGFMSEDGRVRSSYRVAGAKTGRFSCVKPNAQQFPAVFWFRDMFIAPNGRVIIVADFSQIELRIVAEIAGDDVMRAIFASGRDIHAATAEMIYGSAWSKDHRRYAKTIGFGILYGKGVGSLGAELGIGTDAAAAFLSTWLNNFPGVKKWYQGLNNAPATTIVGRRIPLERGRESTTQKNYPIQGSAADLMLRTLEYLDRELSASEGDLLCASVHDEIVLEVEADRAAVAVEILQSSMRDAWTSLFPSAPITGVADAFADSSWARAKH